MRWLRVIVAAAAAFGVLAMPLAALAALQSSGIVLGFGEQYAAPDGSSCTHRGADVATPGGSAIEALADGTVRFAGRVPGPHGGSVLAVSIDTAQGVVSLLPFEDTAVTSGDHVEAGDVLGRAAASGDPSSAEPHMHVGLRRGDMYLDPAGLLAAPPAPNAPPEPQVETERDLETSPKPADAPDPATAAVPLSPQVQTGTAPSGSSVALGDAAGSASHGGAASSEPMGSGVSLAPTVVGSDAALVVGSRTRASAWPAAQQSVARDGMNAAISAAQGGLEWLAHAGAPGVAAIGAAFMACILLLGRAALERRLTANPPVSSRLGSLLQQLRAGDTLRGLTSCSGHAAFTVPGPFSPEEVTK